MNCLFYFWWLAWFFYCNLLAKFPVFKNGNIQPLEFLPYLADNTEQSLKILIQAAEPQKTQVILLSQPVSYALDPALHSRP
ncbi:hypothetical protein AY606_03980 [Acinetobacter sp. SFB]|uniref:hypothetical protein n=1 Tax=Acinetobacter sp. SFB TaxID=1805634 RepID=UPI0007D87156|nr:hypothetical protein [Acinetobacter sp. SFB]OAL79817.1 hypothetical protein AY606_03980 [Acinetobacter sp. SFB]